MLDLKSIIIEYYNSPIQRSDFINESCRIVESARAVELLQFNISDMLKTVNDKTKIIKIIKNPVIRRVIIKYCTQFGVNHRKFDNGLLIEILHDFLICLLHYFEDEDEDDEPDFDDDDKYLSNIDNFKKKFDERDFIRFFDHIDKIMKFEGHDKHETNIGFILFKYLFYMVTRYKWPYDLNIGKRNSRFLNFFDKF